MSAGISMATSVNMPLMSRENMEVDVDGDVGFNR
jgi:hypothetical protein